ncbi:hypothetical protein F4823DRAFT_558303 [Ustulina deusta]|nr:hypothetical protein F4823DRAFT_558303 [Ustulina deusta]
MALTNLGPLPTNFAVAPSCSADLNDVFRIYTSSPGSYYLLQGPVGQTSCYPSGYAADSQQYYSPAQCPTGFTSACKSYRSTGTVQETIVRCCPTQASFTCQSTISHGWEETLGCVYPQDLSKTTVWTVSQVSNGLTALETYTGAVGGINAYQIQKTSTKKSQTHATATKTSTGSGTSGHHGKSSGSSKHGLGSGAIAGIAVGAVAGLAAVLTPLWLKLRNRRRQYQEARQEEDDAGKSAPREMATPDKSVEQDTDDARPHTSIHPQSSPKI